MYTHTPRVCVPLYLCFVLVELMFTGSLDLLKGTLQLDLPVDPWFLFGLGFEDLKRHVF